MDKRFFRVQPFDPDIDKWIEIEGPEVSIRIDYDDVNHRAVEEETDKILKILNENWEN
jgi:hypothetical protein